MALMAQNGSLRLALALAVALCIALEAWFIVRAQRRAYPWREAAATGGVALVQRLARLLQLPVLVWLGALLWQHRLWTIPGASWLVAMLALLCEEFAYYWMHRCAHRVRILWATHAVHHSTEALNVTAALRLGVLGTLAGEGIFFLPLIAFGFPPQSVFGALALTLVYQFALHTELVPRLGPLEFIFNTPAQHRLHHASNERYLDRNFGGMLCIFDRLFGTYAEASPDEPIRYGLRGKRLGTNPLWILIAEWHALAVDVRRASDPRAVLRCLFGPPGPAYAGRGGAAGRPRA